VFKRRYVGSDTSSGVSCPNFQKISDTFGFPHRMIRTWDDFHQYIPEILNDPGPIVGEVMMDPNQFFYPKLATRVRADGTLVSPPLEDLSPPLNRSVFANEMIIGLHPKSIDI
jgi:acetolactate synthase-1/2/3 large subunit